MTVCPWCRLSHPVEQLCHAAYAAGGTGLTRRSFFLLTSMAAMGAMTRWTPLPLVNPVTPGSVAVSIEVDITKFVRQIEIFENEIRQMARFSGKLLYATIDIHAESTQTEKGHVIELSCDTQWHGRDQELPILQHADGPSTIIKA